MILIFFRVIKQTQETKDFVEIQLKTKIVRLYYNQFDTDIDLDDITQIHYHNLIGEVLTISVLLNRVGLLKAEMESTVAEQELDLKIFEAQIKEEFRKKLGTVKVEKTGNSTWKNPTIAEVDDSVLRDDRYIQKAKRLIKIKKDFAIIDSLYWAVKSKDQKLNKLSERIRPEEFESELIEEKINGILIRTFNKLVK